MKSSPRHFLAAFLAVVSIARADLTIVQKVEQSGPQKADMTITMKIKADKIRTDINPQVSAIMDTKTGEMVTLMHAQKMAMAIPGGMIDSVKKQMKGQMDGTGETTKPTPTGRKETISGYACEEYTFTSKGMKIDTWLTKDLAGVDKIQQQMAALSDEADPFKGLLQDTKLDGFPVRTTMTSPEIGTTTVTVVALNENPLSAKEFEVPKDYKSMKMPQIPGL